MLQDKDVSQDPAHVMSLGVLQPKNSEPLLFLSSSQISGFGCFPWLLSSDCFSKKPITSHVSLQIASVCKNNCKVQTEAGEGSIQRAVHLRWVKNKVGGEKKMVLYYKMSPISWGQNTPPVSVLQWFCWGFPFMVLFWTFLSGPITVSNCSIKWGLSYQGYLFTWLQLLPASL